MNVFVKIFVMLCDLFYLVIDVFLKGVIKSYYEEVFLEKVMI